MVWIIENDEGLAWFNSEGFIEGFDFDTFTDEEKETMRLPIGGHWVAVPWLVA